MLRTVAFAAALVATIVPASADEPRPKPQIAPQVEGEIEDPYPHVTAFELASRQREFQGRNVVVHGCTFFGAGMDVVFCAWGERADERLSIPVNVPTMASEIASRVLKNCTDSKLRDRCQFPVTTKIGRNLYDGMLMTFVRGYISLEELQRAEERMAETPGRGFAEGFDGTEFIDKDL